MGSIRRRPESGLLFLDFKYHGQRLREQTALPDTEPNRKRLQKALERIEGEIALGTFDYEKTFGKPLPVEFKTERKTGAAFASPFQFRRHGRSGIEVSELFPRVAESIDDIAVIRSMHADVPNHEPSLMLMNCGDARQVRPAAGSARSRWHLPSRFRQAAFRRGCRARRACARMLAILQRSIYGARPISPLHEQTFTGALSWRSPAPFRSSSPTPPVAT